MAERLTTLERSQVGLESTPGTAVAAVKPLRSIALSKSIDLSTRTHRPDGLKFPTYVVPTRESVGFSFDGIPDYNELPWLLGSLLASETATQIAATAAYTWAYVPDSDGADAFDTLTIERGQAVEAERAAFCRVADLGLTFASNREPSISGGIIGRSVEAGHTMTAAPAALPVAPILGEEVSVYLDDAYGDIGTTLLTRAFSAELSIAGRHTPFWTVDAATGRDFAGLAEAAPDASLALMLEADSAGMALLTDARAGDSVFVRIKATGPTIEAANDYDLEIDLAIRIGAVGSESETDGLITQAFAGTVVHDDDLGYAMSVTLINTTVDLT